MLPATNAIQKDISLVSCTSVIARDAELIPLSDIEAVVQELGVAWAHIAESAP